MGHGGSAGHTLFRVAAQARKVNRHRVETFQRSVPLETSGVVRHLKSTPPTKPDPCPGPRGSKILFSPEPALLVVEDASDHAALIRVAARCAFPGLDVRVAGDGREGTAHLEGTPPFQYRRSHPFPDLATLDLGRGLGLADTITADARRRARILDRWATTLDAGLGPSARGTLPQLPLRHWKRKPSTTQVNRSTGSNWPCRWAEP